MKSLKFLFVLLIASLSVSSQSLSANVHYGTNETRILGVDAFTTLPNGLVLGIGGSHATKTFFTSFERDGNSFKDRSNNIAKNFPELTDAANIQYSRGSFVENRGTLTGLVGYSFNKTTLLSDLGISFRQEILMGNTATYPSNAPNGWYWQSRTLSPKFLYGGSVVQMVSKSVGLIVGYNNIQKLKFGVNFKLASNKILN